MKDATASSPFMPQPPLIVSGVTRAVEVTSSDGDFGTWRWDARDDRLQVDPPWDRILGLADGRGWQAWLDGVPAADREAMRVAWDSALRGDAPVQWTFTAAEGGRQRRLLARARRDARGSEARGLTGILLELTGTALSTDAPAERADDRDTRLALAQEAGCVGAFVWHLLEGRVTWSPEIERLYGVAPGTFGDRVAAWAEHVHADDAVAVLALMQASLARRDAECRFEFRARLPSGAHRWLAAQVRCTYAPDGSPLRVVGVNADIDARKQLEFGLHQSEAWFRQLADALPILVWAAPPGGRPDYVNAPLQRYTGETHADAWERAIHPDDRRALRRRWHVALQRCEPYEARCRVRRAEDGAWRWHTVRATPICEADGTVIRWLGTLVDDHDWRMLIEVNQQLLASEQRARDAAEHAARMKDEFLATLGHELRTPLNAITGWTNLLKRGTLSSADQARAVDVIDRNAQAQRHLIDDLLDASRVIAGHVRLDLQPVYLDDVLTRALDAVRPEAEARGLSLDVEPPAEPLTVTADPARLQQACAHLLGNAVKFTPSGGTVRVRLTHAGGRVQMDVEDTGIGIPEAFLPFVFDRFRQADSPAARRYGGLGLGLAIVRQIVQMHGGQVTASSSGEGQGATFTVTLPAAADEPAGIAAPVSVMEDAEVPPSPLRGQSILIIEDDPDSREMLSVVLENAGGVPVGAATVAEGVRLLGDLQIDVVLSDIGLPGRDGFDLIRTLRAFPHPRVRRAPAIAVTAFTRAEDRARILEAGFDAHVAKPVEPSLLLAAIADVCRLRHDAPDAPPGPS